MHFYFFPKNSVSIRLLLIKNAKRPFHFLYLTIKYITSYDNLIVFIKLSTVTLQASLFNKNKKVSVGTLT